VVELQDIDAFCEVEGYEQLGLCAIEGRGPAH